MSITRFNCKGEAVREDEVAQCLLEIDLRKKRSEVGNLELEIWNVKTQRVEVETREYLLQNVSSIPTSKGFLSRKW